MIFKLDTKIHGNDKARHAQIKVDEFMSESTKPEQTVHIVLDGAAYHRSEMVRNAAKVLNIELHYLPHDSY